ncbi:MAG: MBL fold metallo-hydrolase, partial [Acidobacteriota bacterium]
RIQEAMRKAGIAAIDHLITTHYHTDHFGGVPQLAAAVRIAKFYDHGPMTTLAEDADFVKKYSAYRAAAHNRTITLKPGDEIKLRRASGTPPIRLRCLASNGVTINETRPGKSANPECQSASLKPDDPSDNARSVAIWLRYGEFDFFDAGDLTWNIEHHLFCPSNPLGEVDLYQVTHHGLNTSNNPLVMKSLRPTVAIMNNGPRKGGHPETVRWLQDIPSLKALYQMHLNTQSAAEENTAREFIANLAEQPDDANSIIVAIDSVSRSFTVTNGRTGTSQTYPIK